MDEILNMHVNDMPGISFDCSCGRHHVFALENIMIGKGALSRICEAVEPYRGKKLFLFSDNNTFQAAGERVQHDLTEAGFSVKNFVFETGNDMLIPDEHAIGRLMLELEADTSLLIAVGSGVLNDIGKYISYRTRIPYMIVCTAPSMDGYVSDNSALTCNGKKISYHTTLPVAVVGDTELIRNAPMRMVQAGFGDVLGKLTALADWKLSNLLTGEYCCETCVTLVQRALQCVTDNTEAIRNREEKGIDYLFQTLVLTGIAMCLVGVSRPASGAEHMLSHYWEMDFQARGMNAEMHGIKVGIATPVIAELFDLMRDEVPAEAMALCPTREACEALLRAAGAPVFPKEIGVDRDLFYRSMLGAYKVRNRYSILQLALEKGRLEACVKQITDRIYGKEA